MLTVYAITTSITAIKITIIGPWQKVQSYCVRSFSAPAEVSLLWQIVAVIMTIATDIKCVS